MPTVTCEYRDSASGVVRSCAGFNPITLILLANDIDRPPCSKHLHILNDKSVLSVQQYEATANKIDAMLDTYGRWCINSDKLTQYATRWDACSIVRHSLTGLSSSDTRRTPINILLLLSVSKRLTVAGGAPLSGSTESSSSQSNSSAACATT